MVSLNVHLATDGVFSAESVSVWIWLCHPSLRCSPINKREKPLWILLRTAVPRTQLCYKFARISLAGSSGTIWPVSQVRVLPSRLASSWDSKQGRNKDNSEKRSIRPHSWSPDSIISTTNNDHIDPTCCIPPVSQNITLVDEIYTEQRG